MVKTRGPTVSLEAMGAIGSALIFSKNKGRSYAKKLTRPKQPQTPAQLGQRAITSWINAQWGKQTLLYQLAFQPIADEFNLPLYQAYIKWQLLRWQIYEAPSMTFPPNPAVPAATAATLTPTARNRTVLLTPSVGAMLGNIGFVIHHSLSTGFTPTKSNAIATITVSTPLTNTYVHGPLTPGTHYYRATPFAIAAAWGTPSAEQSAVIS